MNVVDSIPHSDTINDIFLTTAYAGRVAISPERRRCPAPIYYPSWKASIFVKVIGLSSEGKRAFRLNSTGVK